MVQLRSVVNVVDNSGIKQVRCIGFCGKTFSFSKQFSKNFFVASVLKIKSKSNSKFKKGSVLLCFLLMSKKEVESIGSRMYLKNVQGNFATVVTVVNGKYNIPYIDRSVTYIPFNVFKYNFIRFSLSRKVII
ncbi:hypothetical protein AB834_01630 [PVC group bacterium (ex Bugula neritina AB1)]|nr:hypothetical protein AB834_01630 [PVC group bacterium (ex Bugula neritina AB1)]